jgi:hypothetical protein
MTAGASTSAPVRAGGKDLSNQPWTEKYRPRTLDDVAANTEIIDTIKRLTDESRLPHLLLYGPPGEFPSTLSFVLLCLGLVAPSHEMRFCMLLVRYIEL